MSDIANLNIHNSGQALSDQHNIIHSEIQLANTDSSHSDLPVSINNSDNSVLSMSEVLDFVPCTPTEEKFNLSLEEVWKENNSKNEVILDMVRAIKEKTKELRERDKEKDEQYESFMDAMMARYEGLEKRTSTSFEKIAGDVSTANV